MKTTILGATGSLLVAAGIAAAGVASASPTAAGFDTAQRLTDGPMVSSYTVSAPKLSTDTVNFPVQGKLYESTVNFDAVQGTVAPAIPFFNARAADGQNYRVLFQALTPQGLPGTPLPQGAENTGKIYFDVTGPAPTSVVYNDAVQDRLVWGT